MNHGPIKGEIIFNYRKQNTLVHNSNGIESPTIQVLLRGRNSYNRDGPEYVHLSRYLSSLDQSSKAIFFIPDVSMHCFNESIYVHFIPY